MPPMTGVLLLRYFTTDCTSCSEEAEDPWYVSLQGSFEEPCWMKTREHTQVQWLYSCLMCSIHSRLLPTSLQRTLKLRFRSTPTHSRLVGILAMFFLQKRYLGYCSHVSCRYRDISTISTPYYNVCCPYPHIIAIWIDNRYNHKLHSL